MSALAGKKIVVTRAVHQAESLMALLRNRGAVPLSYPCIAVAPPEDTTLLDTTLQSAASNGYDWLILTSSNAVFALAQRLKFLHINHLNIPNVLAIGKATAQTAQEFLGINQVILPPESHTEALVQFARENISPGTNILLPQSDIADSDLDHQLGGWSAKITQVTAYRTIPGSGGIDLAKHLHFRRIDALTFTSPSTIDNCLQRLAAEGGQTRDLHHCVIACLGKTTAAAVQKHGLSVHILPAVQTINALTDALEAYFQRFS